VEGPTRSRFGVYLRQLRNAAGLTQEELAAAEQLSPRSVSDLERGVSRTARPETARRLAAALGLTESALVRFRAAAAGRQRQPIDAEVVLAAPVNPALAMVRALPRDLGSFTGRAAELSQLTGSVTDAAASGVVGIYAIGGLAGIGKTSLAVHAAHQLAPEFPDGQMFLHLHAHTPGRRPVDPSDALASLLRVAGYSRRLPSDLDGRSACWRTHLAGKKVLLVLDDAASHEQVRPLLPGTEGSLVLVTSRRRLAGLEDVAVISLDILPEADAAQLFAATAGRPSLGADDPDVAQVVRLCGCLPLAVGMLGRQLAHHPAWTVTYLAAALVEARNRLDLLSAENLSVAAAFDLSYRDLTAAQRRLFRRLGLHPGADVDGYAAAVMAGTSPAAASRTLRALYDQHLITEPVPGRYRMHDLLRAHARTLAASDEPAIVEQSLIRLLNYFLQAAMAASAHIAARVLGSRPPPTAAPPACAPPLSTSAQAAQWLEEERANLHAAVGYAAASGHHEHAVRIAAAVSGFLFSRGYWEQIITLQRTASTAARRAGDRPGQAAALNQLTMAQALTGATRAAAASQRRALTLYRDLGDRRGEGDAQHSQSLVCQMAGDYPAAARAARRALNLYRQADDRIGQGDALQQLAFSHQLANDYPAATAAAQQALELFRDLGDKHGQGAALEALGIVQSQTGKYLAAAANLRHALELDREVGERQGEAIVRNWLGRVQQLTGDYQAAATSFQQALDIFRDIKDQGNIAATLDEIGVLQRLGGDYPAAADSLQQALQIFRDLHAQRAEAYVLSNLGAVHTASGDYRAAAASLRRAVQLLHEFGARHGEAEALNNLGELLTISSASREACSRHAQAMAIAQELGVPAEEARALEGMGNVHLRDASFGQAATSLRQALAIYQRIGSRGAKRVRQTLRQHGL
jgi:tetratricopeptide (TPR) repeat protein/transcriptional regulator with XRE-family HTH domain